MSQQKLIQAIQRRDNINNQLGLSIVALSIANDTLDERKLNVIGLEEDIAALQEFKKSKIQQKRKIYRQDLKNGYTVLTSEELADLRTQAEKLESEVKQITTTIMFIRQGTGNKSTQEIINFINETERSITKLSGELIQANDKIVHIAGQCPIQSNFNLVINTEDINTQSSQTSVNDNLLLIEDNLDIISTDEFDVLLSDSSVSLILSEGETINLEIDVTDLIDIADNGNLPSIVDDNNSFENAEILLDVNTDNFI